MSIIPASLLTASDLALLGNNVVPSGRRIRPPHRRQLQAVNRSLSRIGEEVARLYPLPIECSVARTAQLHT